jgi:hypothetical protein
MHQKVFPAKAANTLVKVRCRIDPQFSQMAAPIHMADGWRCFLEAL